MGDEENIRPGRDCQTPNCYDSVTGRRGLCMKNIKRHKRGERWPRKETRGAKGGMFEG
jgi:hypothetical protein